MALLGIESQHARWTYRRLPMAIVETLTRRAYFRLMDAPAQQKVSGN
jgi:hypothetical protein